MSLKAKIEAVIYASEEPVTLPQFVGLLGVEAQAELDALEARQGLLLPLEEALPDEDGNDRPAPEVSPAATLEQPARGGEQDGRDPGTVDASTSQGRVLPAGQEEELSSPQRSEPGVDDALGGARKSGAPQNEAAQKRESRERERRLREYFRSLLEQLTADYAQGDRGLEIREVAGGFRFATKPEFHDTVRGFVRSLKPPLKLSLQALETLAVVAYKQPVTAPEVSEIRGVDSGGVLGSLIARKLITTAGRKQVIGRPILYKTTKEFLLRFGLKDTSELPSIEEFERMAGELAEAVQEEIEMEQAAEAQTTDSVHAVAEEASTVNLPDSPDSPFVEERDAEMDASLEPAQTLHEGAEDRAEDNGSSPGQSGNESLESRAPDSGEAEPMRDVHEAQADGVPESDDGNTSPEHGS